MFLRILLPVDRDWPNALLAVLCGFSLVFGSLLLWHFVLPVDGVASAAFAAIGAAGLIRERAWISALLKSRPTLWILLPIAAFSIWTANHALLRGSWDDYVYEFQAVRWAHDYALVPGLANLHGRFGFSHAHHLYAALLSIGPWTGRVNLVVNGLFVVCAFAVGWSALINLRARFGERDLFAAMMLLPCVGLSVIGFENYAPRISNLKADVGLGALTIVVSSLFLELADRTTSAGRRTALAVTIAVTCAMLFAIKLTSAVFGAVLTAAVFVTLAKDTKQRPVIAWTTLILAVIVAAVLARGVMLSGYPLYPASILAAPVDWRVPEAQTVAERTFITTFAQTRPTYDPSAPPEPWFQRWLQTTALRHRLTFLLPTVLIVALLPGLIMRRGQEHTPPAPVRPFGWIVLGTATLATLAVWFVEAPAVRFAWSYFWILAASVVAGSRSSARSARFFGAVFVPLLTAALMWAFAPSAGERWPLLMPLTFATAWCMALALWRRAGAVAVLCLVLGMYPLLETVVSHAFRGRWREVSRVFWLRPSRIPEADESAVTTAARQTRSGLTVHEAPWSTYNTLLPSSPYFNPYLQLRYPPDMAKGFRNTSPLPQSSFGYYPTFFRLPTE